jgi:hypothetical protein
MALGISSLAASERLTAWGTKYSYVKLHTGDPGAAGTSNAATETDRVQATWVTPVTAVAGVVTMTHSDDLDWTTVAASEDYTHASVWSASTGGDFGGSGQITVDPVTVGDDFQLPAGALIITQPCA